ncbi:DMT family transporter [archaeon]|nr:MAG: DMT family transporter [archaeon]
MAATFTGVLLTLVKPDVPDAWGVCVTLLAAFSSSLRWVLNEKYFVQRHTGGAPPNVMVLTMVQGALGMLVLMPFAVNDTLRLAGSHMTAQQSGAFASLILVGGLLASVLLLVELALVSMTSALTLTVIGQLKDIMAILLSVAIYSEIVTPLNAVGIGLVCASTVVYARLRTAPKSKAAMAAAEGEVAGMPPRAARRKHRVCVCCPWRPAPAARAAVSRGPASQNAAPVPGERSRGHAVDMAPCQELSRAGALGDTAGAAALEGDDDGFDDIVYTCGDNGDFTRVLKNLYFSQNSFRHSLKKYSS